MEGPEPNGVIAVFATREAVQSAVDWLKIDAVDPQSVSILGPGMIQETPAEMDHSPKHQSEVASYWAKWGGALGAVAGAGPMSIAMAAASVGMGPMAAVIAAGIGTIAATAGIGALAGGMVGAGVHEQHAKSYEQALRDGKFVVVVHSDDPSTLRSAKEEFERLDAESVDVHGLMTSAPPRAAANDHTA